MHAVSSELQQYMTGLTNEISRGHFDEAVRLGAGGPGNPVGLAIRAGSTKGLDWARCSQGANTSGASRYGGRGGKCYEPIWRDAGYG